MAGRYKEFDGQIAISEVNFLLDDPRFFRLSDRAARIYLLLWALAVRCRREILPARYNAMDYKLLAKAIRQNPKKVIKSLIELAQTHDKSPINPGQTHGYVEGFLKNRDQIDAYFAKNPRLIHDKSTIYSISIGDLPLILIAPNGAIRIVGVEDMHANLNWIDSHINDFMKTHFPFFKRKGIVGKRREGKYTPKNRGIRILDEARAKSKPLKKGMPS